MAWLLVLLLLIGLGCLFAEFFLFPGLTLTGILGGLCLAAGIYLAYAEYGPTTGHAVFLGDLLAGGLVFWRGVRRLSGPGFAVTEALTGRVGEREHPVAAGDRGRALSDLRPGGTALIGGHRLEVFSQEGFLEAGQALRVVRLTGQRVYVVADAGTGPSAEGQSPA